MAFPATIEQPKFNWLPGERPIGHAAHHNTMAILLKAIQDKIGIDDSAVTTSLDYKLSKKVGAVSDEVHISAALAGGGFFVETDMQAINMSIIGGGANLFQLQSAGYAAGKILVSDVNGNVNWDLNNDADFYKYSIVTSVTSGNLTVAIKNYEGNDPTASKPIKIQIGGVVRTITGALSTTCTGGFNRFNVGSAELATKEIDFFSYAQWKGSAVDIGFSRLPYLNKLNDGISDNVSNSVNEKAYWSNANGSGNDTNSVVNIGRFNATLSAGAGYTWSIPATSVIINRPILENQKQKNQLIVLEGINKSTSYTTSVTMDFSSFIEYDITAQAGALLFNNPSGTAVNGQKRMVRIKDNGTARALTYGTQFASGSATLLTTTVISKKSWMGFEWDSTDSKWYCIAVGTQP